MASIAVGLCYAVRWANDNGGRIERGTCAVHFIDG